MTPEEHAAMIGPRARLAAERSILTTVTPADRIPSHGQQLTVEPSPHPWDVCWDCDTAGQPTEADTRRPEPPAFGAPAAPGRPVTLNLWDQSADSLPETWSAPR